MRLCCCLLFPLFIANAASLDDLKATLLQVRGVKDLSPAQHALVRDAAVHWLDEQVRSHRSIAGMNRALKSAGLILPAPATGNSIYEQQNTGYLDELSEELRHSVRLIRIPIGTGSYCSFDITAVVYDRTSISRQIAVLNAKDPFDRGRYLVQWAASWNPANGDVTIASAWFLSWCTGTYKVADLRADRIATRSPGRPRRVLFRAQADARAMEPPHDMQIFLEGREASRITFRYTDTALDDIVTTFPSVKRFEVSGHGEVVAETSYPETLVGFLSKQLESDKGWAGFSWDSVAVCSDPNAWEITVHSETRPRSIFRISRLSGPAFHFDGLREKVTSGCRPVETWEQMGAVLNAVRR